LKDYSRPCTITSPKALKAFGIYKTCGSYGIERDERCENPLDIYVVPYMACASGV